MSLRTAHTQHTCMPCSNLVSMSCRSPMCSHGRRCAACAAVACRREGLRGCTPSNDTASQSASDAGWHSRPASLMHDEAAGLLALLPCSWGVRMGVPLMKQVAIQAAHHHASRTCCASKPESRHSHIANRMYGQCASAAAYSFLGSICCRQAKRPQLASSQLATIGR